MCREGGHMGSGLLTSELEEEVDIPEPEEAKVKCRSGGGEGEERERATRDPGFSRQNDSSTLRNGGG